jgi:hypothetical protein
MNPLAHPVLDLLLEHYPALISIDEVVRHIAPDPADFVDRDDVHVAIQDLAQVGLVHRLHEFAFASAAAVSFAALDIT